MHILFHIFYASKLDIWTSNEIHTDVTHTGAVQNALLRPRNDAVAAGKPTLRQLTAIDPDSQRPFTAFSPQCPCPTPPTCLSNLNRSGGSSHPTGGARPAPLPQKPYHKVGSRKPVTVCDSNTDWSP